MGINNYYQWEYIGKYIHFDLLLVEKAKSCFEMKKKVEKMKDGFARWGAFIRGATFFHHEISKTNFFFRC